MAAVPSIEPKTDATLNITVKEGSTPVTTATVTATVIQPSGVTIATDVACPHTTLGQYPLAIAASWSEAVSGDAIEGTFIAEVKVVNAGKQRVRRFYYQVAFKP